MDNSSMPAHSRRTDPLSHEGCERLQAHLPWLRTVVRNRVDGVDAVTDVLQEVAVAVYSGSPPSGSGFAPWLYRVAVRQCLLYRRKLGRQRKLCRRFAAMCSEFDVADPLDGLLLAERRAAVRDSLKKLNDVDRDLLVLKYTENWTYAQLAEHLGVTADTVEYRLLRARRHMRELLAQGNLIEAMP